MAAAAAALSAGSSGSSVYAVSEEKTNGTRLSRLLVDGGTHSYILFTSETAAETKEKT